jgi:predicted acetyltransferase
VVKVVAGNKGYSKEVIALLLNQRGNEVQITKEVVKTAAGNRYSSKKVIVLLLARYGNKV